MTSSWSWKTQFCIIACHFLPGSYSKISIMNARPADRDTDRPAFWIHPASISLLSLRTTDELSAVARPRTCPSSLTFTSPSPCLGLRRALLLGCTVRVCKFSGRSTIVIDVNPRSLAPFFACPSSPISSSALWASVASSCLPRPWQRQPTVHFLPQTTSKRRHRDRRRSCKITHKNIIFKSALHGEYWLTSASVKGVRFHLLLLVKL